MFNFENLEEILRQAQVLSGINDFNSTDWLKDKNFIKKFWDKNPKCFLKLNGYGDNEQMILPICNRMAMEDPKIIDISINIINKLSQRNDFNVDNEEVVLILKKLEFLKNRFSKDIPKPPNRSQYKSNSTKFFNNIKDYLNKE